MKPNKGLDRLKAERDAYAAAVEALDANPSKNNWAQGRLLEGLARDIQRVVSCYEEDKPIIATLPGCAFEMFIAMDLDYMNPSLPAITGLSPFYEHDIAHGVANMAVPHDLCTFLRYIMHSWIEGNLPRPTAMITLNAPCDTVGLIHEASRNSETLNGVPVFSPDLAYVRGDLETEQGLRSVDYYAEQLQELLVFLEKHTGKKLDMNRLREVVEESNRQIALWREYYDLSRVKPAPHGSWMGAYFFAVGQNWPWTLGKPYGTQLMKEFIADAEERVQKGKGWLEDEKIRVGWFDARPSWYPKITNWLEEDCKAVVVCDWLTLYPYQPIDTSTDESIWRGLALRGLDHIPMTRQSRTDMSIYIEDVTTYVKDFQVDCIFWPMHMGHKDQASTISFMHELCQELEVPSLELWCDIWDETYLSMDAMKGKITNFFDVMGLG